MDKYKTVVVTGADGLLGGNLVRQLQASGRTVRAFVQTNSPALSLKDLTLDIVRGDLLDSDTTALDRALRGCDAVFHCAAVTDMKAPDALMWRVNYEGTRRVVDAALRCGVARLVHTASASSYAFGSAAQPGDESCPFPELYKGLAYMESKRAASQYVRSQIDKAGLDAVFVAPTFMIGPHDARPSSGELIRQFLVRRMPFVSPGGRNFVYVGDVAQAMVNALERAPSGAEYILAGENLTYMEFFTRVARAAHVRAPLGELPHALVYAAGAMGSALEALTRRPVALTWTVAKLACMYTFYTPAKAVAELGMPQTSLDQAIGEAIAGLTHYGHL